jgi:hypothetical protein
MIVHEVVVRVSMGKCLPLGRLLKIMELHRTVYLVQPVLYKWNVVIVEVRHDEQVSASSSWERLHAHSGDVKIFELIIIDF